FVLGESRGEPLEVVGQVRNFMVNESIHAARFIGDRGFVITFRFVDPLFTFDLSDPQAPRQVGELEVPGVSTYLHPYGADQLIGVGRRAEQQAWRSDLQLQLFDVSTLATPQVLDTVVIGEPDQWSWSIAAVNPHAFTLFGDVLSLPVGISSGNYYDALSGFLVYRMDPAGGFTPIGRVDHKQEDDGSGSGCPPVNDGSTAPCSTFAPVRFNAPLRSVVLEEVSGRTVLYTLSEGFLKADAVGDTLTPIQAVPLAQ
ncbi:MAG: beta-propeller domain-containing protein, partial [Burkholderiales bacterium]